MAEPMDVGQVVLDALQRIEKEIHAAAERVALAIYVGKLVEQPEYQAGLEAAEQAMADGFPDARPAEDVLAEARALLDRRREQSS